MSATQAKPAAHDVAASDAAAYTYIGKETKERLEAMYNEFETKLSEALNARDGLKALIAKIDENPDLFDADDRAETVKDYEEILLKIVSINAQREAFVQVYNQSLLEVEDRLCKRHAIFDDLIREYDLRTTAPGVVERFVNKQFDTTRALQEMVQTLDGTLGDAAADAAEVGQ